MKGDAGKHVHVTQVKVKSIETVDRVPYCRVYLSQSRYTLLFQLIAPQFRAKFTTDPFKRFKMLPQRATA